MPGRIRRAWDALTSPVSSLSDGSSTKFSATSSMVWVNQGGVAPFSAWGRDRYAEQGYRSNVIARLCVRLIADAVASLPLLPFRGEDEAGDNDPLRLLLARPNPWQGQDRFLQHLAGYHLIGGDTWLEGVPLQARRSQPRELYVHPSTRWETRYSADGVLSAYRFNGDKGWKDFPLDPVTGFGDVLHIAEFNPLPNNGGYGLSPMDAAARWIDLDNAGADLNVTLARGVNPSLALGIEADGASEEEIARWRAMIEMRLAESRRTGVPLITAGKVTVQRLADSLQDMQWSEGMHEAGRRICAAWNVPHVLVIPGESTYANREMAHLELWEHTVIPFARLLLGDIVPWLQNRFQDDGIDIRIDEDAVSALEPRRKTVRDSALVAFEKGMLSLNEARLVWGYEPAEESADVADMPAALRNAKQADMLAQAQQEALRKPAEQQEDRTPGANDNPFDDEEEEPEEEEEEPEDGEERSVVWDAATKSWRAQPRYPAGSGQGGQFAPLAADGAPLRGTSLDWQAFERYLRSGAKMPPLAVTRSPPQPPPASTPEPKPNGSAASAVSAPDKSLDFLDEEKARSIADLLDHAPLIRRALPVIRRVLERFGKGVMDRLNLEVAFDVHDRRVSDFLEAWGAERIKELVGTTTKREIGEALADVARSGGKLNEAVTAIRSVFNRASETRAKTIALTETIRAASFGTLEGMRQGGVERSQWISSRDAAVRDTHKKLDGQIKEAGQNFVSPSGAKALGPGLFDEASETVNCRCFLLPLPDGDAGDKSDKDLEWKFANDEADPLILELEEAVRAGFRSQARDMITAVGRRFA